MFLINQPIIRTAEVLTTMPAEFLLAGDDNDWLRANQKNKRVSSFLEGPVLDPAGNLYVTDVPHGRIFRIDPNGNWDLVTQYDGEPNGMKFISEKKLLIADYRNGLVELDIASGNVRLYLERRNSERFKGVNDLTISKSGEIYFTDQGQTGLHDPTGRVHRLNPDGRLDTLLTNGPSPNGLALSADETVLYVAMTRGNCVWRLPLQADGSVSKVGQFFTSYGPVGPDGMCLDHAGRLVIANPGLALVWILNERGEPEEIVKSPMGDLVTNVCVSPPQASQTLYITEAKSASILQVDLDRRATGVT